MRKPNQMLARLKQEMLAQLSAADPKLASELQNVKVDWFRVKNEDGETPQIFIYGAIGGWWGLDANEFVRELNTLSATNIDVRINSPGGSLFDGIAIYNALVKHPANITVYVDSLAASAASIIAMGGDEVVMMVGSQMMIHDALGIEIGNAADFMEMAKFLDRQSDNIAGIYKAKASGTVADWRERMLAETWMFADEAIALGLADRVYDKSKDKKAVDPAEDSQDDSDTEDDDIDLENTVDKSKEIKGERPLIDLMNVEHDLSKFDYKYKGREEAPNPINDVDKVIDMLQEALLGKVR